VSILALFVCLLAGVGTVSAESVDSRLAQAHELDEVIRRAQDLPKRPTRYLENIKMGTRSVTFNGFGVSPSDPKRFYVVSMDGFVFGSNDGGLSWEEGRIVIKRRFFYGALRPRPISGGAPFSVVSHLQNFERMKASGVSFLNFDTASLYRFPYGTTGEPYLDFSPDSPAFWGGAGLLGSPGSFKLYDSAGGEGAGGDMARLGIGLKTSAVWLARLLRKRGRPVSTMNLQLALSLKGVEPTIFEHVAVHPTNPDEVMAASHMGMWRSRDGGMSWFLAFSGSTRWERFTFYVGYHPENPKIVFLGTGQGLRISRDGGVNFQPIKGSQLSTAGTRWISWFPGNADIVYAATNIGVFRSDDGGETWRWIYYNTLRTQNYVTRMAVHPTDPDRVTIATLDGLFQTRDGGKNWTRSGGFLFTGQKMWEIVGNPTNGDHLVCISPREVWESFDGGKDWVALYINDSEWTPRYVEFDPHDKDLLWVVTSNEILKITSKPPVQPDEVGLTRFMAQVETEPELGQTIDKTLRNFGVHRGKRAEMRESARTANWLPQVNLCLGYAQMDAAATLHPTLYNSVLLSNQRNLNVGHIPELNNGVYANDPVLERSIHSVMPYMMLSMKWDFAGTVFDVEEAPFGRMFIDANKAYLDFRFDIQRIFEERRRVMQAYLTRPSLDDQNRILLKLRLEELTAQLNIYTDGLWQPALEWVESLNPLSNVQSTQ
jgi:hypothetical protein